VGEREHWVAAAISSYATRHAFARRLPRCARNDIVVQKTRSLHSSPSNIHFTVEVSNFVLKIFDTLVAYFSVGDCFVPRNDARQYKKGDEFTLIAFFIFLYEPKTAPSKTYRYSYPQLLSDLPVRLQILLYRHGRRLRGQCQLPSRRIL
jgi:hypothetical protein